jgi:hypothetical protein
MELGSYLEMSLLGKPPCFREARFTSKVCLSVYDRQTCSHSGIANLACEPAIFVAAFGDSDPGVLQIAQGLFGLPTQVIGAVLGNDLSSDQITTLKAMIPANVAVGLDECVKRCGLSF